MSFGFSIGDIITCSQIAINAYDALKSAPREFEGLRLEVRSLNATLKALADEEQCPTSLIHTANPQRREDMRMLLENCTNGISDLQKLIYKYSSMKGEERTRFIDWVRFAARSKQSPREKLAIHTASINMFLTNLSNSSLGRLEFLLKNARQSVPTGPSYPSDKEIGFNAMNPGGQAGRPTDLHTRADIWTTIGQDLRDEGIMDQDLENFQEEIKSYLRYLKRGETPFWKTPVQVTVQSKAERREVENKTRPVEELRRMKLEEAYKSARARTRGEQDRRGSKEEKLERIRLGESERRIQEQVDCEERLKRLRLEELTVDQGPDELPDKRSSEHDRNPKTSRLNIELKEERAALRMLQQEDQEVKARLKYMEGGDRARLGRQLEVASKRVLIQENIVKELSRSASETRSSSDATAPYSDTLPESSFSNRGASQAEDDVALLIQDFDNLFDFDQTPILEEELGLASIESDLDDTVTNTSPATRMTNEEVKDTAKFQVRALR
jgi:hypothetical protein